MALVAHAYVTLRALIEKRIGSTLLGNGEGAWSRGNDVERESKSSKSKYQHQEHGR